MDPSANYAFIECEETRELFGRDVWAPMDLVSAFEVGACVRFNAHLNHNGQPNVSELVWEPLPGDLPETGGTKRPRPAGGQDMGKGGCKGGCKGKGKSFGAWGGDGSWGACGGWGGDAWGNGGADCWGGKGGKAAGKGKGKAKGGKG